MKKVPANMETNVDTCIENIVGIIITHIANIARTNVDIFTWKYHKNITKIKNHTTNMKQIKKRYVSKMKKQNVT